MRNFLIGVVAAVTVTLGCAAPKPVVRAVPPPSPRVVAPPAPPPKKIKLAVLPVEKLLLPKVAEALNERLRAAAVAGVNETTTATISMEVAAMQLDCTQPTPQCYSQIARHFEADRLLWGEIERARSKRRHAPVTIRIVLFDVAQGAVVGRSERTFPGANPVPDGALDELLARALTTTNATAETRASQP
jgi:hypothetical protein